MKYIVKEFDGDDKLRYAVIETLKYSGLRKDFSDIYHGIILPHTLTYHLHQILLQYIS